MKMIIHSVNPENFEAWTACKETMKMSGDGWRLEVEPGAPLGEALLSMQCAFAELLAHENKQLMLALSDDY